jgi:hypothetical protein
MYERVREMLQLTDSFLQARRASRDGFLQFSGVRL